MRGKSRRMYCTSCGKGMPGGAAACPYCVSEAVRTAGGTPPPPPPQVASPTTQPPGPASIRPRPAATAFPIPGRGSKRRLLAAVAATLVLAVAAGTAIPLLLAKHGEETPQHGIEVTLRALGDPSIDDLQKTGE